MVFTESFLATYLAVLLFLVTRAACVSLKILIKCVGASHSFPLPFPSFIALCAPDTTLANHMSVEQDINLAWPNAQ